MSRQFSWVSRMCGGFPRVSGDEPRWILDLSAFFVFSPRERG